MAVEERWPELAKIKERYPEAKKTFIETLMPAIPDFLDILRHGMVPVGPDHWQAPGIPAGTANTAAGITLNMLAGPTNSLVPDPYSMVLPEDKELMEKLLTELGPDIKKQTEELIKTEIRDSMMLGGNWVRLKELLKSGVKPRVLRKRQGGRDPLFLVFGDGINTEIEEVRVLG